MCVAGPEDSYDDPQSDPPRGDQVPPHRRGEYYESRSRDIDIIKLNGSIELAPILGSCPDVIVDIVETGKTLLENHPALWRPSWTSAPGSSAAR
ncbi:MAG: hypothetical protein ACLUJG_16140 [Lawsonibacter sp.]